MHSSQGPRPRQNHTPGWARASSQLQLYMARQPAQLTSQVLAGLAQAGAHRFEGIKWVAPLEEKEFEEPRDGAFLDALNLSRLCSDLRGFWPRGGPRWDALGLLQPGNGVLLVEAKSYPEKLFGSGCRAKPGSDSYRRIEESLRRAKA